MFLNTWPPRKLLGEDMRNFSRPLCMEGSGGHGPYGIIGTGLLRNDFLSILENVSH
jgi:hypothetical protein